MTTNRTTSEMVAVDSSVLDNASEAFLQAVLGEIDTILTAILAVLDVAVLTDTTDTLTVGYTITPYAHGTKSSGTLTPEPALGILQTVTNGGAHTLAPPTTVGVLALIITNNGSAGALTTSGFDEVIGDDFDTTNANVFECLIVNDGDTSSLQVRAKEDNA